MTLENKKIIVNICSIVLAILTTLIINTGSKTIALIALIPAIVGGIFSDKILEEELKNNNK